MIHHNAGGAAAAPAAGAAAAAASAAAIGATTPSTAHAELAPIDIPGGEHAELFKCVPANVAGWVYIEMYTVCYGVCVWGGELALIDIPGGEHAELFK